MEITITLTNIITMFSVMIVLAVVPDASAFAVVARSMTSGFMHGFVTTLGILVGDIVFILIAVLGLATIAATIDELFIVVKYLGAAYLIWLGVSTWRSKIKSVDLKSIEEPSWWQDFLCGLFITLADPKAILFYVSFLPAFLDLSRATILDTGVIIMIAVIALGIVKLGYAYMADRSRLLFDSSIAKKRINMIAGSVMIATGLFLVVKI